MELDLKCVVLNAENLFVLLDRPIESSLESLSESQWQSLSTSQYTNKPLHKLLEFQKILLSLNADLILLSEVGGLESLTNFNKYFLGDQYKVALVEGNSDRSIDVGFLIHNRLPTHFNLISNKDRPINFLYPHEKKNSTTPSHKFSRDVAELHLFIKEINKPYFIFLLTHLKSPLDPNGIDPGGTERRKAEFKTLLEIYKELSQQHPSVPITVCGDFNGNASRLNTDREFEGLYDTTDLEDVLEVSNIPQLERSTFFPLRSGQLLTGRQIDFSFLSKISQSLLNKAKTQVFRYPIRNRPQAITPETSEERLALPSDHYPLVFEFNLKLKD